ncbi:Solute carrier family 41 member 2 [Dissostichus eleginoides]|nr:Solute carrier family 41 member 2 [Dissostichus eleginoides]
MSIPGLGGPIGDSLGSSLTGRMSGWSSLSLKPVSSGRIASVFQTMVPTGYTKLQDERLSMVDLSAKPDVATLQNGYRQETTHIEGRRILDRASRSSVTLSDCGDGGYSETEPMLAERRLSGEEADEEEEEDEEAGPGSVVHKMPKESLLAMALQILLPFLLAGFGTVCAGMVLDIVQHWEAFQYITEIFILGNLEMTLASRLSTAVNVGKMDSPIEKWNLIIGNLALKQVQATVVGFLAAVAAVTLGWIPEGKFQMSHAVLLCSSSVATAFIASMLQGFIMVGVIVGSKKTGINPDNVATPIAASFGDLITLAILAWISQGLYKCLGSIGGLILDKTVSDPNLAGIVVYTPVINGIAPPQRSTTDPPFTPDLLILIPLVRSSDLNNPDCSQTSSGLPRPPAEDASRFSTHLHFHCAPGEVPEEAKGCYYPCRTFWGKGANHRSAQVLLLLVVPGHLIFLYTIHLMKSGHTTLTPIFMSVYLAAALLQIVCSKREIKDARMNEEDGSIIYGCQKPPSAPSKDPDVVWLLLCIADWMVHSMWRSGKDPDSFSIPYLTALGDLLGTALLALSFHFLWVIGDQDSDVGD